MSTFLGDMHIPGVGQLGMASQVGAGDPERLGPGPVGALPPHDGVGPVQGDDLQGVAVGELLATRVDPGVEAGTDQVAYPGMVPVGQGDLRRADLV